MNQSTTPSPNSSGLRQAQSPFTLAASGRMPEERVNDCHLALTKFIVKGLHPFATVESNCFRDMCRALNPKYTPPSRSYVSDTLIPSWYGVEKANVISELKDVPKLAITSDGWTSLRQDHYLTVTVHYTSQGSVKQKVLHTRPVYKSQTGEVVAEEISDILEEFEIEPIKIVAVTVDNAGNMDVAIKKLQILKIGCFAHTLNLAAQKIYKIASIDKWAARIRAVVVWFKRSSMSKTVLTEKQNLLGLPQHSLILDVKTRWNSLYLMIERFMEQYPAIQAAALDPRLRKALSKDNLDRVKDEDFHKAEEFVQLMKILYTSTLCVSCEKNATCGQILPILQKLEDHFTVKDEDTMFVASIKEKVWENLSQRYQNDDIQAFLHEATAMDPRFKGRTVSDATWDRLRKKAVDSDTVTGPAGLEHTDTEHQQKEESSEGESVEMETIPSLHKTRSALEELFSEEDRKLRLTIQQNTSALTLSERVDLEVELYKSLPPITMAEDPVMWWWEKRAILPLLTNVATSYLCAQASSTPSERVFSTAGNTLSQESCTSDGTATVSVRLRGNKIKTPPSLST
ncbi:E3 SUMO-protein ligase ZBED1-like [Pimephales promelas]|uniref:E3 SUMO-protein ligase ZBED1-like n=1 Tax=Pimephales promelas TaxID=90988 RepID=UPI001955AF76|nr:E3 SUMO-protein ligase ZBED1-like [Pimephales promelas]